jgi:hypothetical protein
MSAYFSGLTIHLAPIYASFVDLSARCSRTWRRFSRAAVALQIRAGRWLRLLEASQAPTPEDGKIDAPERAEHTARLIDVDLQLRLDQSPEAGGALPRVQLKLFIQAIQISGA